MGRQGQWLGRFVSTHGYWKAARLHETRRRKGKPWTGQDHEVLCTFQVQWSWTWSALDTSGDEPVPCVLVRRLIEAFEQVAEETREAAAGSRSSNKMPVRRQRKKRRKKKKMPKSSS